MQALAGHMQSVLHIAARKENVSMAWLLWDCGANVNLQDCDGRMALHLATEHGLEAMVRLLLDIDTCTKADYNSRQSPLSDASIDVGLES